MTGPRTFGGQRPYHAPPPPPDEPVPALGLTPHCALCARIAPPPPPPNEPVPVSELTPDYILGRLRNARDVYGRIFWARLACVRMSVDGDVSLSAPVREDWVIAYITSEWCDILVNIAEHASHVSELLWVCLVAERITRSPAGQDLFRPPRIVESFFSAMHKLRCADVRVEPDSEPRDEPQDEQEVFVKDLVMAVERNIKRGLVPADHVTQGTQTGVVPPAAAGDDTTAC